MTGKEDGSSNDTLQQFAADTLWKYFQGAGRKGYEGQPHLVKTNDAFVLDNGLQSRHSGRVLSAPRLQTTLNNNIWVRDGRGN